MTCAISVVVTCNFQFCLPFSFLLTRKAAVEKPCIKNKAPYFNSPSIPSFRMFEFEDDLGNYVEDPKLRRLVGLVSFTACHIDRVISVI